MGEEGGDESVKDRRGLTFLELLVMLSVLLVVAGITIPKFRTMIYQSREGRTKTHLGDLRGAIAIYYSDNFGLYPSDEGLPKTRLASALVPKYLKAIPEVELIHHHPQKLNSVEDHFTDSGDWMYITLNGFVAVNCWHLDTQGEPISNW